MARRSWVLVIALVAVWNRSPLQAQQPKSLDIVGRPATPGDSVPATIADAESQARRRMPIEPNDTLPLQHVSFTQGGEERRCVDVGAATGSELIHVRSADFVVGGFSKYSGLWYAGYGKLAWLPVRGSTASPTHMTLSASRLDGSPVQQVYDVVLNHGEYYMYPADIRLPSTGRWLLIATAGSNWGCFVFELQ